MFACLSVSGSRQTATRRLAVCGGAAFLALTAIARHGSLLRIQAAENDLPGRRVHAALTKTPLDAAVSSGKPFGPPGQRAGQWPKGALASPVSAGPQGNTLPVPGAVQGGLVTLRGNTRPEAKAANDRGRVSDGLTLNHMMLQLQRTPRAGASPPAIHQRHPRSHVAAFSPLDHGGGIRAEVRRRAGRHRQGDGLARVAGVQGQPGLSQPNGDRLHRLGGPDPPSLPHGDP